ncbi:MAG: UDP-N-acetylmuramate dehydrogenase [Bacteroidales bacterium]|jgi:UDP-N-acetylmuramate dehydrogenase|nr:UDP-N-acetylmuramate dehydrogenase [Bacteroidales bacterium]MDD3299497.1 UDP-N-acetylmuramate dehydrogenase [Bacteroidales bacterium]MDD3844245.1 UDP-N-acetylmuramate dehydrogenase [Bacteroidales bacterium]MDD4618673.1 UDP-N-acetylmuramate dehydrogenase [Bacteroidales bacterium]
MKLEKEKNLKELNTLGFDIKAKYFANPQMVADLKEILLARELEGEPFLVTGSGSNILYTGDFSGVVIHPSMMDISIEAKDDDFVYIRAGAGVEWDAFVEWCVNRGWGGVENLSGIPGCVGASPVQNIGAYGTEVKETIESVEFVWLDSAKDHVFCNKECEFGYRDSVFKNKLKGKCVITYVTFKLSISPKINIGYADVSDRMSNISDPSVLDIRKAILEIRENKLPDPKVIGNAGSFFKNPVVANEKATSLKQEYPQMKIFPAGDGLCKLPAGWLIEQCGFKGLRDGNVGVHPKQALVLVAYPGSDGKELLELAEKIKRSVKDRFDIDIDPEVNIIVSS